MSTQNEEDAMPATGWRVKQAYTEGLIDGLFIEFSTSIDIEALCKRKWKESNERRVLLGRESRDIENPP